MAFHPSSTETPVPRKRLQRLAPGTVLLMEEKQHEAGLPRQESGCFHMARVTPLPSTVSLTLIFVCDLYLGPGIWQPGFQTAQALASTTSPSSSIIQRQISPGPHQTWPLTVEVEMRNHMSRPGLLLITDATSRRTVKTTFKEGPLPKEPVAQRLSNLPLVVPQIRSLGKTK